MFALNPRLICYRLSFFIFWVISKPRHMVPISGPGGRSITMESIMPPPQRTKPVPALLQINSRRLRLRSTCISTGAQSRPITRITPTAVIELITTSADTRGTVPKPERIDLAQRRHRPASLWWRHDAIHRCRLTTRTTDWHHVPRFTDNPKSQRRKSITNKPRIKGKDEFIRF